MTIIITPSGLPKGPRKKYPFPPLRMATILGDGSMSDACITKFPHCSWVDQVTEHVFSRAPAEFLGHFLLPMLGMSSWTGMMTLGSIPRKVLRVAFEQMMKKYLVK